MSRVRTAGLSGAIAFLGLFAGLAAAHPAPAGATPGPPPPRVAIQGAKAPGPAGYDRVWVRKYGPSDPQCVMVMVPGSPTGQDGFSLIAPERSRPGPRG